MYTIIKECGSTYKKHRTQQQIFLESHSDKWTLQHFFQV